MAWVPEPPGGLEEEYQSWLAVVQRFAEAFVLGGGIGPGTVSLPSTDGIQPGADGTRIILFSPHPDDEILTSALPLRLAREAGASIHNVAVTLGTDPARKAARKKELDEACRVAGFSWQVAGDPQGFDPVTPASRHDESTDWQHKVASLADILAAHKPDVVLFPHGDDGHPTHIGVHHLASEAVRVYRQRSGGEVLTVETEFWHPMKHPNLLLGLTAEHVALQITALTRHQGEIARNPYHLRQPARLMDNVRRGAELIGGAGSKAPDILFGELYRVSKPEGAVIAGEKTRQGRIIGPLQQIDFALLRSLACCRRS